VTGVAEIRRGVLRLPAGPLLEAVDAHCAARGVGRARALGVPARKCCWRAQTEGTVSPRVARRLCNLIGQDPHEVYGAAWWEEASTRCRVDRRRGTRRPHLDAGPLVAAVEARVRRVVEGLMPLTDERPAHAEAVREVFGDDAALLKTFQRARARGWVLLETAERCCDAFGWHPRELWGDRYDAVALAGLPEDHDVWEGVAA
jgi:hypothetical protein